MSNNKNLYKTLSSYISLSVLGMLGLSCYILADTFFIANGLGPNGLTALNLIIPVYGLINATGLMLGMGGATYFSIKKNQGGDTNSIFTHTLVFALLIGLIITLIGKLFTSEICALLGADEIILPLATEYLSIQFVFAPIFILNNVFVVFIRNDNNPKLSMLAMLAGTLTNIVFDWVFIFPLGMGMWGAAFATCLAPVIGLVISSFHFITHRNSFKFIRSNFNKGIAKVIFFLGLSAFITELSSGIIILLFNLVILKISGNVGVAAYGIVANIALVGTAIFTGISQGSQPLISKHYGKGDIKTTRKIFKFSLYLSLIISAIIYSIVYIFNTPIVALFNNENNITLQNYASDVLNLYFIGFFFACINIIVCSYLNAIAKPLASFIVSISRGLILISIVLIILSNLLGLTGVWLTFLVTEAITMVISIVLYRAACNKKNTPACDSTYTSA